MCLIHWELRPQILLWISKLNSGLVPTIGGDQTHYPWIITLKNLYGCASVPCVNDKWTEHIKHLSGPLDHSKLVMVQVCIHPRIHTLVAVTISSGAVTVQTHSHNDGAALGAIQDSSALQHTCRTQGPGIKHQPLSHLRHSNPCCGLAVAKEV